MMAILVLNKRSISDKGKTRVNQPPHMIKSPSERPMNTMRFPNAAHVS